VVWRIRAAAARAVGHQAPCSASSEAPWDPGRPMRWKAKGRQRIDAVIKAMGFPGPACCTSCWAILAMRSPPMCAKPDRQRRPGGWQLFDFLGQASSSPLDYDVFSRSPTRKRVVGFSVKAHPPRTPP